MGKIEKLTTSQWDEMIEFREEYRRIGLSTDPADRLVAEDFITQMYAKIGEKKPMYFWFDGQMTAELALNLLKNGLGSNLWSNLESNLESNLGSNLRSNLGRNLESNLRSNLMSYLWSNL